MNFAYLFEGLNFHLIYYVTIWPGQMVSQGGKVWGVQIDPKYMFSSFGPPLKYIIYIIMIVIMIMNIYSYSLDIPRMQYSLYIYAL